VQQRIAHAYIFTGSRGVGKTTTARLFAKAINCEHPMMNNPCNTCDRCLEITEGRSIDVYEIDGASNNSVAEVRDLREAVRYGPSKCKYKIYIIDEVHMLSNAAFNALLKTLEEPPPYLIFIFATTEISKVPATILSRCQRYDFRRNTIEEIISRLSFIAQSEKISIDADALHYIAKKSDGSMRDSQSIFDQLVALCGNEIHGEHVRTTLSVVDADIFFTLTDLIQQKNIHGGLELVDTIVTRGFSFGDVMRGIIEHFRNILVVVSTGSTKLIEVTDEYSHRYEQIAQEYSENDIIRYLKLATDLEQNLRTSPVPRFRLELGLTQLIKMEKSITIEQLLQQCAELKNSSGISSPNVKVSSPSTFFENREKYSTTAPVQPKKAESSPAPRNVQRDIIPPRHQNSTNVNAAIPPLQTSIAPLSVDGIITKWENVLADVKNTVPMVGTHLTNSRLLNFDNGKLTLGCTQKMAMNTLQQNTEIVRTSLEKIYGMKFKLETILLSEEKRNEYARSSLEEYPALQHLVTELGAIPIERS
jgi:DNA polymerase-3 subunit gamma/tau